MTRRRLIENAILIVGTAIAAAAAYTFADYVGGTIEAIGPGAVQPAVYRQPKLEWYP